MEVVAWSLAGVIPAAVLGMQWPLPHAPSIALAIVCGRFKGSYVYGAAAIVTFTYICTLLLPVLGSTFYFDQRWEFPATARLFPFYIPTATHGQGIVTGGYVASLAESTIWCAAISALSRIWIGGTKITAHVMAVACSILVFSALMLVHVWIAPQGGRFYPQPEQWTEMRIIASFWTLLAVYGLFPLALFYDQFKRGVAPTKDRLNGNNKGLPPS